MTTPTNKQIADAVEASKIDGDLSQLYDLLRKMTRVELLKFEDRGPQEMAFKWNVFYDVLYEHDWPLKKESVQEYLDGIEVKMKELMKHFDGIQKKVDRITKLIENAQFTITGKDALKL